MGMNSNDKPSAFSIASQDGAAAVTGLSLGAVMDGKIIEADNFA